MSSHRDQLAWYLGLVAAWFVPQGMLSVLVPWVVGVELGLGGHELGIAQSTFTLPALLFILLGGLVADRGDERRILMGLHLLVSVPAFLLGLAAWRGVLSYPLLLAYLFTLGTVSAFMRPARDSILTRVAGGNVQRAVTAATGAQFGVQVVGFLLAGTVEAAGSGPLFKLMAALLLVGALAASRMAPLKSTPRVGAGVRETIAELREGLSRVRRSPVLRPVVLLNLAVGVFYMGAYFVAVPMLVLRVYGGGAQELALTNVAFMMGTLFSTMLLLRHGGVRRRQARALGLAIAGNGVSIASLASAPPFALALLLMFAWGAGTGVAMSMGRTIVQELAPVTHRARVLAVYALGFLGGAPLGSFLMGVVVEATGPRAAALSASAGVALCLIALSLRSTLWRADLARHGGQP